MNISGVSDLRNNDTNFDTKYSVTISYTYWCYLVGFDRAYATTPKTRPPAVARFARKSARKV